METKLDGWRYDNCDQASPPDPETFGLVFEGFGSFWSLGVARHLAFDVALIVGFVSIFLAIRPSHTRPELDSAIVMFRHRPYLLAVTLKIEAI